MNQEQARDAAHKVFHKIMGFIPPIVSHIDVRNAIEAALKTDDAPSAPPVMAGVVTDEIREKAMEAVAGALSGALDCTRVWDAWSYGTMTADDFEVVAEDASRLAEIVDAAFSALTAAALSVAPGRADAGTRKVIIDAFKESCEFRGAYDVAGIILRACAAIDAALQPIAGERRQS